MLLADRLDLQTMTITKSVFHLDASVDQRSKSKTKTFVVDQYLVIIYQCREWVSDADVPFVTVQLVHKTTFVVHHQLRLTQADSELTTRTSNDINMINNVIYILTQRSGQLIVSALTIDLDRRQIDCKNIVLSTEKFNEHSISSR